MKYILLGLVVFACACSTKKEDAKNIYNNKEGIIGLFASKSVIRSRGQNIILLYTHNGNKTNKYFFEIKGNLWQFLNDSIEYVPDILQLKNVRGSDGYKQELISHLKPLIDNMDKLNIRDIKGDLSDIGIGLKIYIKELKGVVLFVPDPKKVNIPYWLNYLNSMKKLDNNWFYSTEDE